ncbi:YHS domain-containing protein [Verrucomicrobiaceae bacterium 227]
MIIIAGFLPLVSCQSQNSAASAPTPSPSAAVIVETKPVVPAPKIEPKGIKPYPLDRCLVTDEPLDEWDDMQTIVYQGQEMKFCCEMCLGDFKKDPQKYLKQLPKN